MPEAEAALYSAIAAYRPKLVALSHAAQGDPLGGQRGLLMAAFDPSGERIITASYDGTGRAFDVRTGKQVLLLPSGSFLATVVSAEFSLDGRHILTSAFDMPRLWDARNGSLSFALEGCPQDCRGASFDRDQRRIIAATEGTTVTVWDRDTGAPLFRLKGHEGAVFGARFGPKNQTIATASSDGTVRLWRAADGKLISVLPGEKKGFQLRRL